MDRRLRIPHVSDDMETHLLTDTVPLLNLLIFPLFVVNRYSHEFHHGSAAHAALEIRSTHARVSDVAYCALSNEFLFVAHPTHCVPHHESTYHMSYANYHALHFHSTDHILQVLPYRPTQQPLDKIKTDRRYFVDQ